MDHLLRALGVLKEISNSIALGVSREAVFTTALEQMLLFMEADLGSIQLLDAAERLHTVAHYGEFSEQLLEALSEFTIMEGGLQQVLESNGPRVLAIGRNDLPRSELLSALLQQAQLNTSVIISLKVKGHAIGVLSVAYQARRELDKAQLAWFEIMANLVSINLYNWQLLEDLNAKQVALQRAWQAVTDVQEMERRRLSRELHDDVGQALTSLMLRLKALQAESDIEVINVRLNGLRYLTGQTLEEVRRISEDLRPVVLDELGLVPAARSYVHERATWSKIEISFEVTGDVSPMSPELESACYRAIQEGLTNVLRHSQATQASVNLAYSADHVTLTISDNGVGASYPLENQGLGLLGMQERARLLGGTVAIVAEPGAGFTLNINYPRNSEL